MKVLSTVLGCLVLAGAVAVGALGGCAGGSGETVELSGLGFSMALPPGWRVDDATGNSAVVSSRKLTDSLGSVFIFPLEGASLNEYVQSYSPQAQASTPKTVSGLDAVEVVEQGEARRVLTTYIRNGANVIVVTLGVLPQDFPEAEESLRAAMGSIAIQ
jgi:hypothetical protein